MGKAIPQFPVKATTAPLIEKKDGNELPSHIPPFLPPFPEKHTYIFTPVFIYLFISSSNIISSIT